MWLVFSVQQGYQIMFCVPLLKRTKGMDIFSQSIFSLSHLLFGTWTLLSPKPESSLQYSNEWPSMGEDGPLKGLSHPNMKISHTCSDDQIGCNTDIAHRGSFIRSPRCHLAPGPVCSHSIIYCCKPGRQPPHSSGKAAAYTGLYPRWTGKTNKELDICTHSSIHVNVQHLPLTKEMQPVLLFGFITRDASFKA